MINLIPKPLVAKEIGDKICFSTNTKLCGVFLDTIELFYDFMPSATEACENTLTFIKDDTIVADGYKILYVDGNIEVYCSDKGGALYGFMTLVQLAAGNEQFEAVEIEDKPEFRWRSFMLDCARQFWSVDHIKKTLDILASLKMNVFHWHLCDDQGWRVEIKKYPILTQKGTARKGSSKCPQQTIDPIKQYEDAPYGEGLYYTQEDVKDIVSYAAARNIIVIPEIDVPGHASAILACMPELSCDGKEREVEPRFGILDNILWCANPQVYEVLKNIFDELCELFPAPYFHIGGDEVVPTAWENCEACQALMKEQGLKDHVELHGYFNNVLVGHLKSKGRQTIGWNEIISDKMDETAIPQVWTTRGAEKAIEWSETKGQVILTQYNYVYSDMAYSLIPLSKTYNYSPNFEGFADENILGIEMPQWTEYIPNDKKFDFQTYVRLLAISEVAWTDVRNKHYEDFETRVETMRPYFKSIGINLAPKRIYCGNTFMGADNMTEDERKAKGRFLWSRNPYYELELLDY